jgi:diguanylate cyclase (GGDEF)-like protein/PAS domain S-box-containing protein
MEPSQKTENLVEIRSRKLLRLGFALVLLVIGFIVIFGLGRLSRVQDTLAEVVAHEQVAIEMLFRMQQAARERSVLLYGVASTVDPFERDELLMQHGKLGGQFNQARIKLSTLQLDEVERALLEQLNAHVDATRKIHSEVIDELAVDNLQQAQAILNRQAIPSQNKILASINVLLEYEIGKSHSYAQLLQKQQGQTRFFMVTAGVIAGLFVGLISIFINRRMSKLISGLASSAHNLLESNHSLEALKLAMDQHSIVSIADIRGDITFVNEKFCQISEYKQEELVGQNHRILNSGIHSHSFFEEMWNTISSGKVWQGEVCNRKKNGALYWVSSTIVPFMDDFGRPSKYISVRTDITENKEAKLVLIRDKLELEKLIQERTAELRQLASTDALTGAYNRRKFNEVLQGELARVKRYASPLTLIMFDIDYFKKINDTFGHQAGDEVLHKLALLVSKSIRDVDIFARWGGEEFAILIGDGDTLSPHSLAEKLRQLIETCPFAEVGKVTCSFGVTEYREGDDQKAIVKRADNNLYRAKAGGRNRVCFDE